MKRIALKSVFDGFVLCFVMLCLVAYIFSDYVKQLSFEQCAFISIISAIVISLLFFMLVFTEKRNKNIVQFFVLDLFCIGAFFAMTFAALILTDARLFPPRELSNADGIFLLLHLGFFLITSLIVRLITVIVFLIKNKVAGITGKTGDGSGI